MSAWFEINFWTLLDISVRSAVLALLVAGVLLVFRFRNPNVHHRAWTLMLLVMLGMPVLQQFLPVTPLSLPRVADWVVADASVVELSETNFGSNVLEAGDTLVQPMARDTEPLVTRPMVHTVKPQAVRMDASEQVTSPVEVKDAGWTLTWAQGIFFVYVIGLLSSLARMGVGIWAGHRIVRRAKPITPDGLWDSPVLESSDISVPLTIGAWRSCILLPVGWKSWSPAMLRSALHHEQTHIYRRDYFVGLLAELNKSLYWFHPLAWLLRTRLATLAEQVCDDLVVTQIGSRQNYAEHLLQVASCVTERGGRTVSFGTPMARTSQLETRIDAALDVTRPLARRLGLGNTLLLLVITLSVVLFTAGIQAEEQKATTVDVTSAKNKTTNEKAKNETEKTAEPSAFDLSKVVQIINSDGEPIVGATVTAWAIRTQQGSHGLWSEEGYGASSPPVLTTDTDGEVVIRVPKFFATFDKNSSPKSITCRVNHPEYAQTVYNDVSVTVDRRDRVSKIKLLPGAQIEVTATAAGKTLPIENLFVLLPQISDNKLSAGQDGTAKLPRLSAGFQPFRLVYIPDEGEPLLSDVQWLALENGDDLKLQIEMEPGNTVHGKLDAQVPRPVLNGHVSVRVIDSHPDNAFRSLSWCAHAIINEDGTFTLTNIPSGNLQVTAICDGYTSVSGSQPDFVKAGSHATPGLASRFTHPQVFAIGNDHNPVELSLKMQVSADCEVHVADENSQPLANVVCSLSPNVQWWQGGSALFCYPRYSTLEAIGDPEYFKKGIQKNYKDFYSAKTDKQGIAIIRNAPARSDFLNTNHPGYVTESGNNLNVKLVAGQINKYSVTLFPEKKQTEHERPEIPAAIHMHVEPNVSIIPKPKLPKQTKTQADDTELAGVVVDELGLPLTGVRVDAWSWHPGNETTTDDQGRFRLTGFEREEDVEVQFTKEKFSPSYFVSKQAGTDNWTIVLTQGTWLEGKVLGPTGQPLADAEVKAARGPFNNPQVVINDVTTRAYTDHDGVYRLHLEQGTYDVQVRVPGVGAARHQKIELNQKQKKQLDIRLDKGVTFQAMIRNSITNEPVEGITLWNWRQPGIEGTSDAKGLLEIKGMMEGEFEFGVTAMKASARERLLSGDYSQLSPQDGCVAGDYARWWSPQGADQWSRKEIPKGTEIHRNIDELKFDLRGDVYSVDIFVEPLTTITGRVVDPDGKPVEGATVAPAKTGSGNSITGDTRYSYKTDADGKFTMKLPASKKALYNLVAHDGKYQEWRTWANGVGEPLRTTPGQTIENVVLRLTRPATVRGRVTNALGTPRAHVKVRAAAFDKLDIRYYLPETETDAEGRYELRFIRPGSSYIQIQPYWLAAENADSSTSKIVDLKSGDVKSDVNFRVDARE